VIFGLIVITILALLGGIRNPMVAHSLGRGWM
jgi:hypothetical protein